MIKQDSNAQEPPQSYGVLIVEDEVIAGRAHANYVQRTPGFHVAFVAKSGRQALAVMSGQIPQCPPGSVDLILLDMNLGESHGIQLLRALRAQKIGVDVIAVTAARDMRIVKDAMSLGVLQYVVKPFTYETFVEKLDAYRAHRASVEAGHQSLTQETIDSLFSNQLEQKSLPTSPKVPDMIQRDLINKLQGGKSVSAAEASEILGVSRVTARRYLEAMADVGTLLRMPRYGTTGRPVLEYTPAHDYTENQGH